jgi:hypothetical protein
MLSCLGHRKNGRPLRDGLRRGAESREKLQRKCVQDAPAHNPRRELKADKIFFIWIRRNPLKSPESAKGIQGNPSFFAWNYLGFLGFIWLELALGL